MMCVNLTRQGLERLEARAREIIDRLRLIRDQDPMAMRAGSLGSMKLNLAGVESELPVALKSLEIIRQQLSDYRIPPIPASNDQLRIFHDTTLRVKLKGSNRSKTERWIIGAYGDTDLDRKPVPIVAYDTAWIRPLLGMGVGHSVEVQRGGTTLIIEIEKIDLASGYGPDMSPRPKHRVKSGSQEAMHI